MMYYFCPLHTRLSQLLSIRNMITCVCYMTCVYLCQQYKQHDYVNMCIYVNRGVIYVINTCNIIMLSQTITISHAKQIMLQS